MQRFVSGGEWILCLGRSRHANNPMFSVVSLFARLWLSSGAMKPALFLICSALLAAFANQYCVSAGKDLWPVSH